jgi:predicted GIY-YIG superfamily endonuclease
MTPTLKQKGPTVYLIHFRKPYKHARHYLGYSQNLDKRITDHLAGMGARLLEVVTQAGIEWKLARTWPGADRGLERRLKRRHGAASICPICSGKRALRRATYDQEKA